jgi:hypothetical protein
MLIQLEELFTINNIYLWINFGILPFWLMLIFIPNSKFTQFFINSILLPLILSFAYIYVTYQLILLDEPLLNIFMLYLNLDNLYTVFATESFLLIFWLHFVSINIFTGSWVSRDSIRYSIPRFISAFSLILIYFVGPVGLLFYWLFRVFFAKRISFHD